MTANLAGLLTLGSSVVADLFDALPQGITLHDDAGRVIYANDQAARLLGVRRAVMVGHATPERGWQAIYPDGTPVPDAALPSMAVLRTGRPQRNVTIGVRQPDGSLCWIEVDATPVALDPAGAARGVLASFIDITPRVTAEAAAHAADQRIAGILERISDAFFVLDHDWRFTYVNPMAEVWLRQPRAALLGRTVWEIFPQLVDSPFGAAYRQALTENESVSVEAYYEPYDGWYDVRAHPAADGLAVYFRDVTERHRTQAALAASEALHRNLVEQVPAVIYTEAADGDQLLTYVSPYVETLLGYPPEAFLADRTRWTRCIHPDDRDSTRAIAQRSDITGEPHAAEYRMISRDGRLVWVYDTAALVRDAAGRPVCWQGVARDITVRKRAQQALTASEARFRAAFDDAPIGMAIIDGDGRLLQVNRALSALLGYDATALQTMTVRDLADPDNAAARAAIAARLLAGEADVVNLESRYVRQDGQVVWVHASISLIRDAAVERSFIVQVEDVSERQEAAQELATTHQRTREVLERIADGFYAIDRDWRFTYFNEAAERILGVSRGDVLGRTLADAFPAVGETPFPAAFAQALAEGRTVGFEYRSSMSGTWLDVQVYPSANGLSVFFRDVNERKAAEAALRAAKEEAETASRLKSVLLSTAAHELRTPLTAIRGYAEMLSRGPTDNLTAEQRDDLAALAGATARLSNLVETLLDLSRIEAGALDLTPEPIDLAALVAEAWADVAPAAGAKGLRLVLDLPSELPAIPADRTRVCQILVNLLANAVRFTDRGTITVRARLQEAAVEVSVRDTGIGIDAAALPRLFGPFWQADGSLTRRPGGIGLGLAITRRLVELHGGELTVESTPSVGSAFTVTLPLSDHRLGPASAQTPTRGSESPCEPAARPGVDRT